MATTIANLSARLTLNTSRFTSGLQRAQKSVKKFGVDVGRIGGQVAKFGAIAGGVAVAGLAALVRSQSEFITTTQRVAERIGIATGELSQLQYAAVATGSSVDRMQEGLTELIQRLGEAKAGTGSAADGLKIIGLEAEALTRMNPAEAFGRIADAINRLPSQSDRVFAIDEIFGGDGREMINLLSLGSEGIRRLGEEADRMGASFDAVDARQVVAATEAMNRLGEVATGLGRQLAIQLSPYIEAAADKFASMATSGNGAGDRVTNAMEGATSAVAALADGLGLLQAGMNLWRGVALGALGGVITGLNKLGEGLVWVTNLIPGVEAEYSKMDLAIGNALLEESAAAFDEAGAAMQRFRDGAASHKVAEMFDSIRGKAKESAKAIARNAAEQRRFAGEADNLAESFGAGADGASKVADELDRLRDRLATLGANDMQRELIDLKNLGAGNEELTRAYVLMKKINAGQRRLGREESIAGMLDDLDSRVRRFGLSERDTTLLDLDALGASDKQLDKARNLFDRLQAKQSKADQPGPAGPTSPSGPSDLIVAGSAQAQQLAFQAARGLNQQDNIPKRQLDTQTKIARSLERIERRGGQDGTGGSFDI